MAYLIGTDIGTSGTKTIVMNEKGKLISSDLVEYDVLTPKPLWAEQWPMVWMEAVRESIRNAVKKSGCGPEEVTGICISGLYGGSGIPLDEEMRPVRPCLIWMDRRASEEEAWVCSEIGKETIQDITHNGTDPYHGYTKILWIKNHEPENWEKIRLFLPPNAYAIYQLTGEVAIDYSSAGNIGGIFDAKRRCWSEELMGRMGIPLSMMPQRIVQSSEIVGTLTEQAGAELGLREGIPVCAGGVDCVVATLGLGVFSAGKYAATIGTSMSAAFVHDRPINGKGLIEMPYVLDALHLTYSFGGAATSGALIKWFRDQLAGLEKEAEQKGGMNAYAALDKEAEQVSAGSNGLILLPYFMGERSPLWNTHARGVLFGLSLNHTKAHVYRAFLEAVAYSLRQTIECAGDDVGDTILLSGGVAKSPLWKQIFADVLGKKIVCPTQDVEANLGDVILAGLGTGTITAEEAQTWQSFHEPVCPQPEAQRAYDQYYALYQSVYKSLLGDFERLTGIEAALRR